MMSFRNRFLTFLLIWLFQISNTFALDKQIIGWLEHVKINNSEFQLKAKIDTGATTSSLNANIIKTFTKDKQDWLRFTVTNKDGQNVVFERKIERYVKIKRKKAKAIERPVIKLGVCVGLVYRELEVNLADRKNFEYHMLIGRNYLQGHFLVDSELVYQSSPSCK